MLKYYHYIYTRRDSTGWGLLSEERQGIDQRAVEALCRRLPASEHGPVYALTYSSALGGFALCSSTVCGSGSDHRGRSVVDVLIAADPAVRADPSLAAVPDRFVQDWDPAWESQSPAIESEYPLPPPPTPETLALRLTQLGVRDSSLPAFLQFLYRALPQQGVAFSLPVPEQAAPPVPLRALADLLAWAAPPALVRNGTASCGPVEVKDLRFYLSPHAGRCLPTLAEGSAQEYFYRQAAEQLRTDPAGYPQFLRSQVLDVLPGVPVSWQAYPGLYLLSRFEAEGEALLRQPAMRMLYLQNLEQFLSYQKESPALRERLHALFTALALSLDHSDAPVRRQLLAQLVMSGDAEGIAALPEALRAEAAALWLVEAFQQPDILSETALARCEPALRWLDEETRRSIWQKCAVPRLAGQPLDVFAYVLGFFGLSGAQWMLRERLLEEMKRIFSRNWMIHPENQKKLADLDRFSRKNGLDKCFENELLRQLDLTFAQPGDREGDYFCCVNLLRGVSGRAAVRERLAQYKPQKRPLEQRQEASQAGSGRPQPEVQNFYVIPTAPEKAPVEKMQRIAQDKAQPPSDTMRELDEWLAQYDAMTETLAGLLVRLLEEPEDEHRLPERFHKEKGLLELVNRAAQQADLSKKQKRALIGWLPFLL